MPRTTKSGRPAHWSYLRQLACIMRLSARKPAVLRLVWRSAFYCPNLTSSHNYSLRLGPVNRRLCLGARRCPAGIPSPGRRSVMACPVAGLRAIAATAIRAAKFLDVFGRSPVARAGPVPGWMVAGRGAIRPRGVVVRGLDRAGGGQPARRAWGQRARGPACCPIGDGRPRDTP